MKAKIYGLQPNSKKEEKKMSENKKYEVEVLEKAGTCDSNLFEKMAKKGDITATSIKEFVGKVVTVLGYSKCKIAIDEKEFEINYYDTDEYGFISTGSGIFHESIVDYFGEVEQVRIVEVKTKKGKTYKAQPIIGKKKEETNKMEIDEKDELPF